MKVSVTGWAWRTPLGTSVDEVVTGLLLGVRAAHLLVDPSLDGPSRGVLAPIRVAPRQARETRFLRRMERFAVEVAREATEHAGVRGGDRVGLFAGFGGPRAPWDEPGPRLVVPRGERREPGRRGPETPSPLRMPHPLSTHVLAVLSVALEARGEGMSFHGANAGAQALASAQRALEARAVDVAIVMAADSLLEPDVLVELESTGAATRAGLEGLEAPYSARAAGFVPGEAAAALVLERPGDAGGRSLALVEAADGADGGHGAPRAETLAWVAGGLVTPRTRVVDGAGRADVTFDAAERAGLAVLVGARGVLTSVSSAMGQLGAAMPGVQVIALAECLRRGLLPPVVGLRQPAPGPLRLLLTREPTRERKVLALSTGAPGVVGAVRVEVDT